MADRTLPQRLEEAIVPPSAVPLVEEAKLTLEAIRDLANKEGWTKIVRMVDEGVKEA